MFLNTRYVSDVLLIVCIAIDMHRIIKTQNEMIMIYFYDKYHDLE
jgi:hypothetical protein